MGIGSLSHVSLCWGGVLRSQDDRIVFVNSTASGRFCTDLRRGRFRTSRDIANGVFWFPPLDTKPTFRPNFERSKMILTSPRGGGGYHDANPFFRLCRVCNSQCSTV